jgi:hypothetical protein
MVLESGIRKKPIPYPVSRIQGSKRHRIRDPDPQHCPPPLPRVNKYTVPYTRTQCVRGEGEYEVIAGDRLNSWALRRHVWQF